MPDTTGDAINDLSLLALGSTQTVDGAIFLQGVIGAGTGGFNDFLGIQASPTEHGFNAIDDSATNDQIKTSSNFTHPVKLSEMPIKVIGGVQYFEIRWDLNESNSASNDQISLDTFKIYTSTDDTIVDFPVLNALTPKYDLDQGGGANNVSLLLTDAFSTGSGRSDYSVLVPVSKLLGPGVDPAQTYMYLYVEFGNAGPDWTTSSTFEEFRLENSGTITGTKFKDVTNLGVKDPGEGPVVGVKIFIDANDDGVWQADERYTFTDAQGNYTFYGLVAGTYHIDEVVPAGMVQTTGEDEVVTISGSFAPGQVFTVDPIGNRDLIRDFTIDKSIVSVINGVNQGDQGTSADDAVDNAGDIINYQIVITNTGELALTNVTLSDLLEGQVLPPGLTIGAPVQTGGSGGPGSNANLVFDLGETWTWTAQYVVQQSDLDTKGGALTPDLITNAASVTAYFGEQPITRGPDSVNTPLVYDPSMVLTKVITSVTDGVNADGSANATNTGGVDEAGDVINYTVTLFNDGNVTLTDVDLDDLLEGVEGPAGFAYAVGSPVQTGGTGSNADTKLDVGETWTWTASYTVKAADITSLGGPVPTPGFITNTADATAKFGADTVNVDLVTVNTPVYLAALAIDKSITSVEGGVDVNNAGSTADDAVDGAGDKINYAIAVSNTGNVALTGVVLSDLLENQVGPTGFALNPVPVESGAGTHGDAVLDVGEVWTYAASYVVQQGDLDTKGNDPFTPNLVTNSASVKALFGTREIAAGPDSVDTPLIYDPSMVLNKVITSVTDGVNADGSVNTTSTGGVDEAGDVINYSITLFNDGNVTLTDVDLEDLLEGVEGPAGFVYNPASHVETGGTGTNGDNKLDVGETWTWTASYTVKAADISGNGGTALPAIGQITNTADATAKFGADTVNVDLVTVNTPVYVANFAIDKTVTSVTGGYLNGATWIANSAGDIINYSITITNTGNVALTKTSIVDTLETTVGYALTGPSGDGGVVNTLEVGETWTFTTSYMLTAADLNDANLALDDDIDNAVEAKFNFGTTQITKSDSVVTPIANVDIEKGVSTDPNGPYEDADSPTGPEVSVEQDMYFKVTVQNTGAVDLTGVVIKDTSTAYVANPQILYENGSLTAFALAHNAVLTSSGNADSTLAVGETWTITYTQGFEYGQHVNTADVTNLQGATDVDAAHYLGVMVGPGVRTPGFWSNLGMQFWDGVGNNQTKTGPTFPTGELLYAVDSDKDGDLDPVDANNDKVPDSTAGLLVGDWNKDGFTGDNPNTLAVEGPEDTLFISYADAKSLINASSKQLEGKTGDGVMMLGRDVVATWLNYLAGNRIDDPGAADDGYSPKHYIQDAVNWLQTFGDANNNTAILNNGFTYDAAEKFDTYSASHTAVKTSTTYWSGNIVDANHSAAEMHAELDFYNNTGAIHDDALLVHQYANPGG